MSHAKLKASTTSTTAPPGLVRSTNRCFCWSVTPREYPSRESSVPWARYRTDTPQSQRPCGLNEFMGIAITYEKIE